jgi:amidase
MNFREYRQYDGLGLAKLVATRDVTAAELLEIAIARTDSIDPSINAVVVRMDKLARERARDALSGPFAGVPFLSKNLQQQYAGVLSAHGCRGIFRAHVLPKQHAEITRRWLQSGVVIFGQTNTPEFGLPPITEPLLFGPTNNPWNLERSPGGSSGGSAAAIAAGIVPMAGGNDVGGSIRIPAAMCGLFGFKPGRGRTPWGPERGEMMHGAATNHVLTRSVRDSAAMLDASHGKELPAPFHLCPPVRPYSQEVRRVPGRLRIAFSPRSPLRTQISSEAELAVNNAAKLLESLGHHVDLCEPAINWDQMFADVMTMMYANAAHFVAKTQEATGCGKDGFEPDTWLMAGFGRALRADEYVDSLSHWQDYQRITNEFLSTYDVYMTPTVAYPPPLTGENATPKHEQVIVDFLQSVGLSRILLKTEKLKRKVRDALMYVPFTELANLTGAPAMSVPLHWTSDGLPLGVHFVAGPSQEGVLFRLAAQLEEAQPWFSRVPSL